MKIDASSSSSALRPEQPARSGTPREPAAPAARPEPPADAIEISPQGRRLLQFPADARSRADLVARLRQEVDAGTYRPDADAVARRIADRIDR